MPVSPGGRRLRPSPPARPASPRRHPHTIISHPAPHHRPSRRLSFPACATPSGQHCSHRRLRTERREKMLKARGRRRKTGRRSGREYGRRSPSSMHRVGLKQRTGTPVLPSWPPTAISGPWLKPNPGLSATSGRGTSQWIETQSANHPQ